MPTRLIVSAVLFVSTYAAAAGSQKLLVPFAVAMTLVVIAALAFAWFIVEEVRVMRGLDELQRRIQLEALAIAYPLAILLLAVLGLLQPLVRLSPDDWSYRHAWPFLTLFYFVGLTIAGRRYR